MNEKAEEESSAGREGKQSSRWSLVMERSRRAKPSACAECHRLRRRCVYENSDQCTRCVSLDQRCLPRLSLRADGKYSDKLRAEHSLERMALQAANVARSDTDLVKNRVGATNVLKLLQELKLREVPPMVRQALYALALVSRETHSFTRLHGAISISAALGISEAVDAINDAPSLEPLSHQRVRALLDYVEHSAKSCGSAFMAMRTLDGKPAVLRETMYHWLFGCTEMVHSTRVCMGGCAGALPGSNSIYRPPMLEEWPVFLANKADADALIARFAVTYFTEVRTLSNLAALEAVAQTPEPVAIHDKTGARYRARIRLSTVLAEGGRFEGNTVQFLDIEPTSPHAAERIAAFRSMMGSSTTERNHAVPLSPRLGMRPSLSPLRSEDLNSEAFAFDDALMLFEDANAIDPNAPLPASPHLPSFAPGFLNDIATRVDDGEHRPSLELKQELDSVHCPQLKQELDSIGCAQQGMGDGADAGDDSK